MMNILRTLPFAHLLGIRATEPAAEPKPKPKPQPKPVAKGDFAKMAAPPAPTLNFATLADKLSKGWRPKPVPVAKVPSKRDAEATAIAAERKRMSAITMHGIQHGCFQQAQHLAFQTDLPAAIAIEVMGVKPPAVTAEPMSGGARLDVRVAYLQSIGATNQSVVRPAAEAPNPESAHALAAQINAAAEMCRPSSPPAPQPSVHRPYRF